jgi:flagellin
MRINHNISSMITQGALYQVSQSMQTSLQRLSTGLRINSAADDAAGLGVSENLRSQVNGLSQAASNTQDAIALLNIADGALNEQGNILQRMRELCVQGLNSTYTSTERGYMGQEFVALRNELDRIATVTNYNKMQLFAAPAETSGGANPVYANSNVNGDAPRQDVAENLLFPNNPLFGADDLTSGNHFNFDIGANYTAQDANAYDAANNYWNNGAADMVTVQFGQMDSNGLLAVAPQVPNAQASQMWDGFGWDPVNDPEDGFIQQAAQADGAVETSVNDKLTLLLKVIDGSSTCTDNEITIALGGNTGATYETGIARVNDQRARIGAMVNTLQHSLNNTQTQMNNEQSAESDIRDVDFATETSNFTKNQILTQSATAMLAQANSIPQGVLALLK